MSATDTTASTLLVAIDISKHRHEVLISVPGKKRRRRLTIMNTLEDFQRLATDLADYKLPDRINPMRPTMILDEGNHLRNGRSSSVPLRGSRRLRR